MNTIVEIEVPAGDSVLLPITVQAVVEVPTVQASVMDVVQPASNPVVEVPIGTAVLVPVVDPAVVEVSVQVEPGLVEVRLPGPQGIPGQTVNLLFDTGTSSYPARPAVASVTWIGPTDPGALAHDGDLWIDTA